MRKNHDILPNFIQNLDNALQSNSPYKDAHKLMLDSCPGLEELESYLHFSDERYKRNLVFRNENFELLLLCWKSGQVSPVHNHKGSWCGVKVLQGTATEVIFEKTSLGSWIPQKNTKAYEGEIVSSFDEDTHLIGNFETKPLATLHCYSPPLVNNDIVPHGQTLSKPLSEVYSTLESSILMGNMI